MSKGLEGCDSTTVTPGLPVLNAFQSAYANFSKLTTARRPRAPPRPVAMGVLKQADSLLSGTRVVEFALQFMF